MSLIKAIEAGDALQIRKLLVSGEDPNQGMDGERTLLTWAIEFAGVPVIRSLLEGGADPTIKDSKGGDALEKAVVAKRKNVVNLLAPRYPATRIEEAIRRLPYFHQDIKSFDSKPEFVHPMFKWSAREEQATSATADEKALLVAAEKGDTALVKQLLETGVNPEAVAPSMLGASSVMWAAVNNRQLEVITHLGNAGADLDDSLPEPPLFGEVQSGRLEMVRALAEAGADVNGRTDRDNTVLFCAIERRKPEIVAEILRQGADPNLRAKSQSFPSGDGHTPLQLAAMFSDAQSFELLIAAGGTDPNLDALRSTLGAQSDDLPKAKRLLKGGIDRLRKVANYLPSLRASPGASAEPKGTDFRGVPTFDVNDSAILVEADIKDVAERLKKHVGANIWKKNVFGKSAVLTEKCYGVVRFVGVPWTGIMRLHCRLDQYPSVADAEFLSESLKCRAIHFGNSDTGGVAQYALFDKGQLQEFFGYSSMLGTADKARVEQHFGVDLAEFDEVEVEQYKAFASRLRTVKLSTINSDLDFINDFFKGQDAIVPVFAETAGYEGEEAEFEFEDFDDDEIERFDFVAVKT